MLSIEGNENRPVNGQALNDHISRRWLLLPLALGTPCLTRVFVLLPSLNSLSNLFTSCVLADQFPFNLVDDILLRPRNSVIVQQHLQAGGPAPHLRLLVSMYQIEFIDGDLLHELL